MWFLYLLGVGLYILFLYAVAAAFRDIAQMKGHFDNKYFWWTFWAAPVGMMMVVALPDRKEMRDAQPAVSDELPDL